MMNRHTLQLPIIVAIVLPLPMKSSLIGLVIVGFVGLHQLRGTYITLW